MEKYFNIVADAYYGYARYLWQEITQPGFHNYFYWLIGVSIFFFALELVRPWRKDQPKFRKDFWLDLFYMFFNFFLFSLIIYNAASNVFVGLFNDLLGVFGFTNLVAIEIASWAIWAQLLLMFVLRDFIQWWVHRLLHYHPRLWEFHKVHHSVEQMGFAAHLRFHWMETVVYRVIEYLPLAMIGFGIDDFFVVHIIGLAIGHFNHSNISINLGPLKYIFNNPDMHIWHHAYHLPKGHKYGINFGLSLSTWDYLFGTAAIPYNGRDEKLGFPGMEQFPHKFLPQAVHGFSVEKVKIQRGQKSRKTHLQQVGQ
ncbi:MAG: sterol desaturase family protein [Cyclobacteriaceae bacterium]|nr:sterol desaturase family protein [Cyclobacteriaceae bacterium]